MAYRLKTFANTVTVGTGSSKVILGADSGDLLVKSGDSTSTIRPGLGIVEQQPPVATVTNRSDLPLPPTGISNGKLYFVTATNQLFMKAEGGWYLLTLVNTSPSITLSTTTATIGADNLTLDVSYTTTEPEGTPVTVAISNSGIASSSVANITHTSANNNIRVVFDGSTALDGATITATVTDGVNTGAGTVTITATYSPLIEDSESTIYTLKNVGNDLQNFTVTDSSDSNHTISTVGTNWHQQQVQTISPYSINGWSASFGGHSYNKGYTSASYNTGDGTTDLHTRMPQAIKFHSDYWGPTSTNNIRYSTGTPSGNSNDFTLECWVYTTRQSQNMGSNRYIIDMRGDSNSSKGPVIYQDGGGKFTAFVGGYYGNPDGSSSYIQDIAQAQPHKWYHLCYERYGTNTNFYINGSPVGVTSTASYEIDISASSSNPMIIGYNRGATTQAWTGLVHDVRFTRKQAIYKGKFTPPTEPLTATANTALLTCNRPYDIGLTDGDGGSATNINDTSNANFVPFSPYMHSASYDKDENGGCTNYGAKYSIAATSDFNFGSVGGNSATGGSFCIEFWYWYDSPSNQNFTLLDFRDGSNQGIRCYRKSDNKIYWQYGTTSMTDLISDNQAHVCQKWTHVALAYSASNGYWYLYVNGVYRNWSITNVNLAWNAPMYINHSYDGANHAGNVMMGQIRIVKGDRVYRNLFIPPSGPLTKTGGTYKVNTGRPDGVYSPEQVNGANTNITASQTKLLCNWNTANWYSTTGSWPQWGEETSFSNTMGPRTSTTVQKFSTPSLKFNGTDETVTMYNSTLAKVMSGAHWREDITIEGWAYHDDTSVSADANGYDRGFFNLGASGTVSLHDKFYIDHSRGNKISYYHGGSNSGSNGSGVGGSALTLDHSGTAFSPQTWHHVALVRKQGDHVKIFIDGESSGYLEHQGEIGGYGWKKFGSQGYTTTGGYKWTGPWKGYLSQWRWTRGLGRYPFEPKRETLTTTTSFQQGITCTASNVKLLAATTNDPTHDASAVGATLTVNNSMTASEYAPRGDMFSLLGNAHKASSDSQKTVDTPTSTTNYQIGTGQFTLECWAMTVFQSGNSAISCPILSATSSSGNHLQFKFNATYSSFEVNGTGISIGASSNAERNNRMKNHWDDYGGQSGGGNWAPHWRHLAVSRDASNIYVFVDGNCIYSAAHTSNITNDSFRIGGNSSAGLYGYISNVRFVKGQCLYKKDFTPATSLLAGI